MPFWTIFVPLQYGRLIFSSFTALPRVPLVNPLRNTRGYNCSACLSCCTERPSTMHPMPDRFDYKESGSTLWMDCSSEYKEIEEEEKEAAIAAEWEERQASFKDRRGSSFIGQFVGTPHV